MAQMNFRSGENILHGINDENWQTADLCWKRWIAICDVEQEQVRCEIKEEISNTLF